MKTASTLLAAGLIGLGALAITPAARAAEVPAPATSTTASTAIDQDAAALTAVPVAPRTIEIRTQPGAQVVVTARGAKSHRVMANARGIARMANMTPGVNYTVATTDSSTVVTPVVGAGRARNLAVTTTGAADSVTLTWQHNASPARGGSAVTYRVEATPVDDETAATTVNDVSTTTTTLTGLDPLARYAFRVTPVNALGDGKSALVTMETNLSALTGLPAPETNPEPSAPTKPTTPPEPAEPRESHTSPAPAVAPAAAPAAQPAPAQPARPTTRTIYVCPDGFADVDGVCTKTMAYTYQTQDYTFTRGKTGTQDIQAICSSSFTDADGVKHWIVEPHECTITRDVFGDIKDPTPAGWEDTGSNWRKQDDAPAGWSDDGTQWVQTAEKVAQVVPA